MVQAHSSIYFFSILPSIYRIINNTRFICVAREGIIIVSKHLPDKKNTKDDDEAARSSKVSGGKSLISSYRHFSAPFQNCLHVYHDL